VKHCTADDCLARYYARGFCKKHYAQTLRHGRLTPELERGLVRTCPATGCGRTSDDHDFVGDHCRKHARQIELFGRLAPETERVFGVRRCTASRRCREPVRAKGLCASHYNKRRWKEKRREILEERREARRRIRSRPRKRHHRP